MGKRYRLIVLGLAAVLVANAAMAGGPVNPMGLAFGKSSGEEILEGVYQYIQQLEQDQVDVPQHVYDFYFACEKRVHPEFYPERGENGSLDQHDDACPGTLLEFGDLEGELTVVSCGTTMFANNDCSYPDCRNARDVIVHLAIDTFGWLTVRTAGSAFDTYLCLWEDGCCGDGGELLASNNNAPNLNNGQRLAAGLEGFVAPGDYYLVLDGAGPAARGAYCLSITVESGESR